MDEATQSAEKAEQEPTEASLRQAYKAAEEKHLLLTAKKLDGEPVLAQELAKLQIEKSNLQDKILAFEQRKAAQEGKVVNRAGGSSVRKGGRFTPPG